MIAALGGVLTRATWPGIDEKGQAPSAEIDQLIAETTGMIEVPNQSIPQVRLQKSFMGCKITFVLPEGEFTAEFGGFKDTLQAFSPIFPGRLLEQ